MSDQNNSLTILQLEARNVTNLKAVRITPDKKMVVLTGANEAGKSNILDVIQALLEGLKLKMPIRIGEDRADATLDLGDIKINKRWTSKGESLEVWKELPDCKRQKYTSPQTFLNELTGKMVDPMKLYHLMKNDGKKFRDTLADIVGLDLSDLKMEEQKIRDERKLVNDKIRDAVAHLKEMTAPNPDVPEEEMTFKEKLDVVNRLREKKTAYDKAFLEKDKLKSTIIQLDEGNAELARKIRELTEQIKTNQETRKTLSTKFENTQLPEQISAEQIIAAESELEQIEQKNVEIRNAQRYRKSVRNAEKYKQESEAYSQKIERIQQDMQTRIANCKFPVNGLSLTDDTVLYEGKPVEIASSGRQIRIFTKMAMAMSPNVKVLLIRDGALLDTAGFNEICQIADEEGFQIWLEKTDDTGKVGIFIENGEIKSIDGQGVEETTNEKQDSGHTDGIGTPGHTQHAAHVS